MSLPADADDHIAFIGPTGSFSDDARRLFCPNSLAMPCASFVDVQALVLTGGAASGLLPTSNTCLGPLAETLKLIADPRLEVVREERFAVRLNALGHTGAQLSQIRFASSHWAALTQCRTFLTKHRLEDIPVSSSAAAARLVASGEARNCVAIGSLSCAERYGLEILKRDVQDAPDNFTVFAIFKRRPGPPA